MKTKLTQTKFKGSRKVSVCLAPVLPQLHGATWPLYQNRRLGASSVSMTGTPFLVAGVVGLFCFHSFLRGVRLL